MYDLYILDWNCQRTAFVNGEISHQISLLDKVNKRRKPTNKSKIAYSIIRKLWRSLMENLYVSTYRRACQVYIVCFIYHYDFFFIENGRIWKKVKVTHFNLSLERMYKVKIWFRCLQSKLVLIISMLLIQFNFFPCYHCDMNSSFMFGCTCNTNCVVVISSHHHCMLIIWCHSDWHCKCCFHLT